MLDSVRLSLLIDENQIDFDAAGGWGSEDLTDHPRYDSLPFIYDRTTGICFKYLEDAGAYNPSRLWIDIPSLPKLIHGNNVLYFTEDDIPALCSELTWAFSRVGISARVDPRNLFIEHCDFAVNSLFNRKKEKSLVLTALKNQFPLSASYPAHWFDHGAYARHANQNKHRRLTGNNGMGCYDKTDDAEEAGLFYNHGILRHEVRLRDSAAVMRRFGRDDPGSFGCRFGKRPTLPELMTDREAIDKLFDYYLSIAGIRPDTMLASIDTVEELLTEKLSLMRKYGWKQKWPTYLLKLEGLHSLGGMVSNLGPSTATVEEAREYRDKVMSQCVLPNFLNFLIDITILINYLIYRIINKI